MSTDTKEVPPSETPAYLCTACGFNRGNGRFCTSCGSPVDDKSYNNAKNVFENLSSNIPNEELMLLLPKNCAQCGESLKESSVPKEPPSPTPTEKTAPTLPTSPAPPTPEMGNGKPPLWNASKPQTERKKKESLKCPHCGAIVSKISKKCFKCNGTLGHPTSTKTPNPLANRRNTMSATLTPLSTTKNMGSHRKNSFSKDDSSLEDKPENEQNSQKVSTGKGNVQETGTELPKVTESKNEPKSPEPQKEKIEVKTSENKTPEVQASKSKTSESKNKTSDSKSPEVPASKNKTPEAKTHETKSPDSKSKTSDTKENKTPDSKVETKSPEISKSKTPETKVPEVKTNEVQVSENKTQEVKLPEVVETKKEEPVIEPIKRSEFPVIELEKPSLELPSQTPIISQAKLEEELKTPPLAISADLLLEEVDANLIIEHIGAPVVNTTIRHRKKRSETKVELPDGILKNSGDSSKGSDSPKNSAEVRIVEKTKEHKRSPSQSSNQSVEEVVEKSSKKEKKEKKEKKMRERSKTFTEVAMKNDEKPKERRGTQTERKSRINKSGSNQDTDEVLKDNNVERGLSSDKVSKKKESKLDSSDKAKSKPLNELKRQQSTESTSSESEKPKLVRRNSKDIINDKNEKPEKEKDKKKKSSSSKELVEKLPNPNVSTTTMKSPKIKNLTRRRRLGKLVTLTSGKMSLKQVKDKPERRIEFVQNMVKLLLELVDFGEEQTSQVLSLIKQNHLTPSRMKALTLNDHQRTALQLASFELQQYIENQVYLERVIKCQACVRMYLLHKKYKVMTKEYLEQVHKRNIVFLELLKMEKQYVDDLNMVIQGFMQPFRKNMADTKQNAIIKSNEMASIFANIEHIHNIHAKNRTNLETLTEKWPFIDGISRIFVDLGPFMKTYGVYVSNFKFADDTVNRLMQDEKFAAFVQDITNKLNDGRDLQSLLALPLNYINRYVHILENLVATTPRDMIDFHSLSDALSIMESATEFVEMNLAEAQNYASIQNVQRRIIGFKEGPLTLYHPKREFCREGILMELKQKLLTTKQTKRTVFLFNDICILTKPTNKGFKFLSQIKLEECSINNVSKMQFDLTVGETIYRFVASNHEEKGQWFYDFKTLIEKRLRKQIFGESIADILKAENSVSGIPRLVEKCVQCLQSKLNTEGIFRMSPPIAEVKRIKQQIERGELEAIDFEKLNIHSVGALLKHFFRELAEPLFTFESYEILMPNRQLIDSQQDPREKLEPLRIVISKLPPQNLTLLKYLLNFLKKTVAHTQYNKMNNYAIAVVFGPTLFRPKVETIETSLEIPFFNQVTQLLLEFQKELMANA